MAVYVIRSPVLRKNYYKIGYTKNDIDYLTTRYKTYYGPPEILYYKHFGSESNGRKMEHDIHNSLNQYRYDPRHEIFRCPFYAINHELYLLDGRSDTDTTCMQSVKNGLLIIKNKLCCWWRCCLCC